MKSQLDILSIGMVTAVGLDAPSSCAAMRARIDGFQETRFVGTAGLPLIGAPVLINREWVGENRLARMVGAAISEAFDGLPAARGQTQLILCLPEEDRPGRPIEDVSRLLGLISGIVDVEATGPTRVISHGRPSGHVALDHARRAIGLEEMPYIMVAGVDSYLTSVSTRHYAEKSRLLTADNPDGFIPGEAAAAVLLGKKAGAQMSLYGLGLSREPGPIYNQADVPLRGDGMTSAYRLAFQETGIDMNKLGYRISDLIGEQYYFRQTALASIRLLRGRHAFQDLWSPAESLGNVGAAVVPIMLGMAHMAAVKGYAAGNPVLVEASNDGGACGAAVLGARLRR